MAWFHLLSILVSMVALFAYINYRYIKLPMPIGLMLISLIFSLVLIFGASVFPDLKESVEHGLEQVDFSDVLLRAMLSFLLFAGAMHIKLQDLLAQRLPVMLFATFGVLTSTFLVGILVYYLMPVFGIHVSMLQALLFGALISPTDPIAVLSILRSAGIPKSLETIISGESLFNDGVAVVVFLTLTQVAASGDFVLSDAVTLFATEAIGGIILGMVLGYVSFWLLKSIDNYQVEVMITLAVVMGGYTLAESLHVSGPLAMVAAGLITGNQSFDRGMSDTTAEYVKKFWELLDEILNAILFVLMGLELLIIDLPPLFIWIGLTMVFFTLLARYVSLWIPSYLIKNRIKIDKSTLNILTWGGLRGGISIALALSLTAELGRELWVPIAYVIVCFSILVQGTTVGLLPTSNKKK